MGPQLVKKFPELYGTGKFHNHIHGSLPLVRVLSRINPVHTFPSYLLTIYFNIILHLP